MQNELKQATDQITFQDMVEIPVLTLRSTDDDTFWWTSNKFEKRFIHEKARSGSRFVDGNNGDKWRVIAADTDHKRLVVENLSQGGIKFVIWE